MFCIASTVHSVQGQNAQLGEKYIVNDIVVTGNTTFSPQTIVAYSGLKEGEEIQIGGERIGNAIKKLWK